MPLERADRSALTHQAETLAAELPQLLVAAEQVAASLAQGEHGRRRSGEGENFWQFRRSQPGDAASAIDWRQSAKSDALFVREREWSAAQSLWLWADPSPSMAWSSAKSLPRKIDRARLLALTLTALLLRGGERVGILGDDNPAAAGRALLPRLGSALLAQTQAALPVCRLPRHGHLLLISDFLVPLPALTEQLTHWAEAGVNGHLLHLLDPAEVHLPYEGRVRFSGLEGEGALLVRRAESLRDGYAARLADHRDGLRQLAQSLGWGFDEHQTDSPPRDGMVGLHALLAGR